MCNLSWIRKKLKKRIKKKQRDTPVPSKKRKEKKRHTAMRDARHHIFRNKLRSMNINQLTEKRRPYLNQLNSCVSVKSRPSWELVIVSLVTDNWFVDLISKAVRNEGRLRETRLRERNWMGKVVNFLFFCFCLDWISDLFCS